jgi:hypothetical protein
MNCQAIKQEGNKKSKFLHVSGVTHSMFAAARSVRYSSQITDIFQHTSLESEQRDVKTGSLVNLKPAALETANE